MERGCSLVERRSETLKRTWAVIRELDAQGVPTAGAFGQIYSRVAAEVAKELPPCPVDRAKLEAALDEALEATAPGKPTKR